MASLNDVRTCFESVNTASIDELIKTIKTLLITHNPRKPKTPPDWIPFIASGDKILSFVNEKAGKYGETVDLFKSGSQVLGVVSGILEAVGQVHWALTGLSMIGHLVTKAVQMSENRNECLQLLQYMLDLAEHIINLRGHFADRTEIKKLQNALAIIVKGSMLCAKQLSSKKLFRFLKSSLDARNLRSLRSEISDLYPNLVLTAVIAVMHQQPERLPVTQSQLSAQAVGFEDREQVVERMLKTRLEDRELRAVVIYGIGGIGKTRLANSVYSKLNLKGYTYCKIEMDSDPQNNEIKTKQEQILKDAFPTYNSGRAVDLRDKGEGRKQLRKAFQEARKPVFLFIDNVLRAEELKELLPEKLKLLGKRIRMLLTGRSLIATDLFKRDFCHGYRVEPLPNRDAIQFVCSETRNLIRNRDVDRIVEICKGIPLALKIVAAEMEKQEYRVDKCGEILNALQTGEEIRRDRLSERMVDFVFRQVEEFIKEAFLDICCFFNGFNLRVVESSVGSGALKALEEAALITIKTGPMQENVEIVVVHDLIKARGRNMAQSTRIRGIKAFERALEEERLNQIEGIDLCCDKDHTPYVLQRRHLDLMSKSLRVLKLGRNISVSNESKMTFPKLKHVYLTRNIPVMPFNSLMNLPKLAVYMGPLLKGGVSIYQLPQSLIQISTFESVRKCRNWDESEPIEVAPNCSLQELILTSFSMNRSDYMISEH